MVKTLYNPALLRFIGRLASLAGGEIVKGRFGGLIGIIGSFVLLPTVGLAQPVSSQGHVQPMHAAAQA
jgi:hypothetical protein